MVNPSRRNYVGRFAPSPSGPLHLGSLVAAVASYADARAYQGRWLLRIEDIDQPRVLAGADRFIMAQLQSLGMQWDDAPVWQSTRLAAYQAAFDTLLANQNVYGCACTRQEINPSSPYPGTCRAGLPPGRAARSWRFKVPPGIERFTDRWQGPCQQDVEHQMGDFVVRRADGLWAYQLAVVIDDGAQGITDIVRGADLLESTAAQRVLARCLGIDYPSVMHVPLARDASGRKLSKQNHAPALDCRDPVATLNSAWRQLGFNALDAGDLDQFWRMAPRQWAARFNI